MNTDKIIPLALRTIELETNAISGLKLFINAGFVQAVKAVANESAVKA